MEGEAVERDAIFVFQLFDLHLIATLSGLLEPTSCSAIKCAITKPTSTSGMAITCRAKKRLSVTSETLKSPRIQVDKSGPITGMAPNRLMITCVPPNDI